jgi:hypothetical protein
MNFGGRRICDKKNRGINADFFAGIESNPKKIGNPNRILLKKQQNKK